MKKALIFGITGQDGSYLSELLLEKGYEVHGVKRRSSSFNTDRIDHLMNDSDFHLHYGDITDPLSVQTVITKSNPDEVYNLAAQSHVKVSFELPAYTGQVDAMGTTHILEAIRIVNPNIRFYQASTSELYGLVQEVPQTEKTPFYPRSPYGVAKMYSYWMVKNYREAYNIFAVNGILFNHESGRRGETFVTRKITMAVAKIKMGKGESLKLGNLDAKRDWGHAKDYVEGMWRMLQQNTPDDYVLATGKTTTVRDFVTMAFKAADINIKWRGEGVNEVGVRVENNEVLVMIDPNYFRPTEVDLLIGDASKAKYELKWEATTPLKELVKEMVESDLKLLGYEQK